jgi:hypothetical protein
MQPAVVRTLSAVMALAVLLGPGRAAGQTCASRAVGDSQRKLLMIPGPIEVHPDVMKAVRLLQG